MTLYFDTETFSERPIRDGTWNYAHHESTEIMLVSYAIGDEGEGKCVDLTAGEELPNEFVDLYLDERVPTVIQNSAFDRTVCNAVPLIPGFTLEPERICDTMVQALAHGMPGALDKLGFIFGLSEEQAKIKEGRQMIHFFCKPNRGKRNMPADHPERWQRFIEYAIRDTTAMRELHKKLPRWNYPGPRFFDGEPSSEHRLWCLDQRINDRGFRVDLDLARAAVDAAEVEKKALNDATSEATEGEVSAATQRDKMLGFILRAHGVSLPDMKQDTLKRRLDDPDLPKEVKHLIDLRMQSARNSSSKYKAVLKSVGEDERLHFTIQFCGAATSGRDAGRIFQPQNMMRPTMPQDAIYTAIEDIKAGVSPLLYSNLPEVLGNAVRGVAIASEGKKLVCSDLKSIEGRGLAWLADDEPIVQFYRDGDAGRVDYDSYQLAYTTVFGGDPAKVTKSQRQEGKPIELGFGYGGGVAAFATFAAVYYLDLDEMADKVWEIADSAHIAECADKWEWAKSKGFHAGYGRHKYAAFEYVKQRWRDNRKPTVQLWHEVGDAFKHCILHNKSTVDVRGGRLKFRRDGQWLRIRLPSGRCLVFLQPRIDEKGTSYMGLDRYTRKWSRVYTHGGKTVGIINQALARDVLFDRLPAIEDSGYSILLRVHDEVITEAPDTGEFNTAHLDALMTVGSSWAKGLPLAADGFEAYRYRKD